MQLNLLVKYLAQSELELLSLTDEEDGIIWQEPLNETS